MKTLHKIFNLTGRMLMMAVTMIVIVSCAKDEPETYYTVTVVSNGGTNFAPIRVPAGETIPLDRLYPDPITIDGGEFMYWCSDELLEHQFDFNTPITGDMTLYAKWYYEEYTVTFEMNGAPEIDPLVVRSGKHIDYFRPNADGDKVFGGWYVDAACSEAFEFETTIIESDTTLYALWHDPSPAEWFTIDNGVLTGCTVPEGTKTVVVPEGVTEIGQWLVLANGGNLLKVTEFVLPQSLTAIQLGAFKSSAITRIIIPKGVKTLTSFTFQDCQNLTSFIFEPGSELESITVNDQLEPVIAAPLLKKISFPELMTDMDGYSISPTCTSLASVSFLRSESAVNFHIRGGGSLWLFGGYYPSAIYVYNQARTAYLQAFRISCANDYDYEQMSKILVAI